MGAGSGKTNRAAGDLSGGGLVFGQNYLSFQGFCERMKSLSQPMPEEDGGLLKFLTSQGNIVSIGYYLVAGRLDP